MHMERAPVWRRAAPWVAPGAALLLACTQLALSANTGLSPWKGGGFGMFSTTDHGGFRSLRVHAVGPGGERRLRLPPALAGRSLRARDLPTGRALAHLAREARAALAPELAEGEALRIEVWRTRFDRETLEPRFERIRAHVEPPIAAAPGRDG